MKKFFVAILAGLFAFSMVGCGKNQTANTNSQNIVRMSMNAEPDNLDPWLSAASDTEALMHNVFEGLMLYNEKGELIPGLASSYTVSDDGKTYTFSLRDDVTFHNGQVFTSKDVVYTYNHLAGLSGETAVSAKYSNIESVNAVDDYTVTITLKEASASFIYQTVTSILPEGYTDQATHPVGTGPYEFVEYQPTQKIVFARNENYYEPSRAGKIDTVEVYIMTDFSAMVSALQSGQLDLTQILSDSADVLSNDYNVISSPQNMVQLLALNNEVEPFNDIRVRQALNYLVDKDEIISGVFNGYATKLDSNFSPVMEHYYNDSLKDYYTVDVDKAKELLKEAGYENGFTMTITVPSNYQQHIDTAQIIAEQLAKANITVNIQTIEWATWLSDVYTNAKYQATIIGLTGKLDPDDILSRYSSSNSKNFYKFYNDEYDQLINDAKYELDDSKRVEMYKRCQEILTENAVAVYLTDPNLIMASRKDLKGFTFYPVTFYDFTKWYYELIKTE